MAAYLVLDPHASYPAKMVTFLHQSRQAGVAVFTSERGARIFEQAWASRLGDAIVAGYILPSIEEVPRLAAEIAEDFPGGFAGIIPWEEMNVELGAALAEALDVDWNPPSVARRVRDKFTLKSFLRRETDLRMNASATVTSVAAALAFQERLGRWPIVIKPRAGASSTDVHFAVDRGELTAHVRAAETEVLLEEYVGGDEFAVNGIVAGSGRFLPTDVWRYDKRDSRGHANLYYESIKVDTHEPDFEALVDYAADVVTALGLRRTPIHLEAKIDAEGPCLIEVAARFAGGNQPLLASQLHHRSLFELAACHYVADLPIGLADLDFHAYDGAEARIVSGIQPISLEVIEAVEGVEAVEALPSFFGFGILRRPGSALPATIDLATKSYEVYLFHSDPAQIARDARSVRRLLQYC